MIPRTSRYNIISKASFIFKSIKIKECPFPFLQQIYVHLCLDLKIMFWLPTNVIARLSLLLFCTIFYMILLSLWTNKLFDQVLQVFKYFHIKHPVYCITGLIYTEFSLRLLDNVEYESFLMLIWLSVWLTGLRLF